MDPTVSRCSRLLRGLDAGLELPPLSHRMRDALRAFSRFRDEANAERRRLEDEREKHRG